MGRRFTEWLRAQNKGPLAWAGECRAGKAFWKSENLGAKAQLLWELGRGWAAWAEETARQRHEARLTAAVNGATNARQISLDSSRAAESQGGSGTGGRRSDLQSLAAAPFVGEVKMVVLPPADLTGSARRLSLPGV